MAATLWICALASCMAWAGCSIEKHYKTLSFFFDGVPNPEAKAKAAAAGGAHWWGRDNRHTIARHNQFPDVASFTALHRHDRFLPLVLRAARPRSDLSALRRNLCEGRSDQGARARGFCCG